MEPDFKAFARAWLDGDPRLKDLDPQRSEELMTRIAEAMDRRRRKVQSEPQGGGDLIVSVPSDAIANGTLSEPAMSELTEIVEKHLSDPELFS